MADEVLTGSSRYPMLSLAGCRIKDVERPPWPSFKEHGLVVAGAIAAAVTAGIDRRLPKWLAVTIDGADAKSTVG